MFLIIFIVFIVGWYSSNTIDNGVGQSNNNITIVLTKSPCKDDGPNHDNQLKVTTTYSRKTYNRDELLALGLHYHDHPELKILPFGAIKTIRKLQINKKKGTRTCTSRNPNHRSVDHTNLIHITPVNDSEIEVHKFIQLATVNIRSLKSKEILLETELITKHVDAVLITETWLDSNDENWVKTSELNKNIWNMHNINREDRRGGGVALVTRNPYIAECCDSPVTHSFESGVWSLNTSPKLHVVGVYRLPNASTILEFTDEFSDYIMEMIDTYKNLVIMGDFNVHVSNFESNEVLLFNSTVEAMGLKQHVHQPTHQKGNILDLVITSAIGKHQPTAIKIGDFLSDHALVIAEFNVRKPKIDRKVIYRRKLTGIAKQDLVDNLQLDTNYDNRNLTVMVNSMNTSLQSMLDKAAPLK